MENKLRSTGLLILLIIGVVGCKRKANIGNGLVPEAGNSNIVYTDTLTLLTRTILEDSIITSGLTYNILGSADHPIFNVTHASVYAQYALPRDNFSFGGATKFDSAVLYVGFLAADKTEGNRSFGDLSTPQRFTVHEISESLDPNRVYYTSSFINYDPVTVGSWNGVINMTDSIPIVLGSVSSKIPACIRFKLDDTWAKNKLFNAPASAFSTNTDFLKYLKGLCITSESLLSGTGGFAYVNLKANTSSNAATGAALVVYYNDSMTASFTVKNDSRRVNTYNHSLPNPPLTSLPQDYAFPGAHINADTCFIQAMGKYKMSIKIPYLYELAKKHKNIAINSAELIIKPYPNNLTSSYYAPTALRLLQPNDSTGRNDFIKDILFLGSSPVNPNYGGFYNEAANEYRFNFTLHVQGLINDFKATGKTDKNKGLFVIIPTDNPISGGQLMMDSRKGSGVKLRIYYTIQN